MLLCKYRHIFGIEKRGVHAVRFMNLAMIDVALTVIGAWLLARSFRWSFGWALLGLFAMAVCLHRIFCVNTTINKIIFGDV